MEMPYCSHVWKMFEKGRQKNFEQHINENAAQLLDLKYIDDFTQILLTAF